MSDTLFTFKAEQMLDKVGDEFLGQRDFNIQAYVDYNDTYLVCTIDGNVDCFIKKDDIRKLAKLIGE